MLGLGAGGGQALGAGHRAQDSGTTVEALSLSGWAGCLDLFVREILAQMSLTTHRLGKGKLATFEYLRVNDGSGWTDREISALQTIYPDAQLYHFKLQFSSQTILFTEQIREENETLP